MYNETVLTHVAKFSSVHQLTPIHHGQIRVALLVKCFIEPNHLSLEARHIGLARFRLFPVVAGDSFLKP